ncbi:MAG: (deoxy)nucleoside triphosphate pyrophosphohydrolase [Sandarakinorhabdus sp.]|nr:(deoxy)nucleoside triphosphate pyrophosphohydrolase [Sandarakinorhabdus sp.]
MRQVHVVAAALVDGESRVLVAQRPAGKSLAGLWEFPGGKIEPGETPETALARELAEELGIAVAESALLPLTFVSHAYADFHLVMLLYSCRDWAGTPDGQQGHPLRWETPDTLSALPMPPADVPLLAAIKAFVAVP